MLVTCDAFVFKEKVDLAYFLVTIRQQRNDDHDRSAEVHGTSRLPTNPNPFLRERNHPSII
jgi:hypothetical protein